MNYVGQKAGAGEITLLPGEIPGLIFTEKDRRDACGAIRASKDDLGMDFEVANRLFELSSAGNSYQAGVLLTELVESSYDTKDQEIKREY